MVPRFGSGVAVGEKRQRDLGPADLDEHVHEPGTSPSTARGGLCAARAGVVVVAPGSRRGAPRSRACDTRKRCGVAAGSRRSRPAPGARRCAPSRCSRRSTSAQRRSAAAAAPHARRRAVRARSSCWRQRPTPRPVEAAASARAARRRSAEDCDGLADRWRPMPSAPVRLRPATPRAMRGRRARATAWPFSQRLSWLRRLRAGGHRHCRGWRRARRADCAVSVSDQPRAWRAARSARGLCRGHRLRIVGGEG